MKQTFILPLIVLTALTLGSCHNDVALRNYNDSLSYVLGQQMGTQFIALQQYNGVQVNKEITKQAFADAIDGAPAAIDDTAMAIIYARFTNRIQQTNRANEQNAKATVKSQEQAYFDSLTVKRPQVKKDKSGIYYEVLTAGHGRKARVGDRILFDYSGYNMLTGQLLDQTYGNREPIMHVLGEPMFKGLIAGIELMNAGSKYRLYIPNELAFGALGTNDIPPYTPVIYDVELHNVYDD